MGDGADGKAKILIGCNLFIRERECGFCRGNVQLSDSDSQYGRGQVS